MHRSLVSLFSILSVVGQATGQPVGTCDPYSDPCQGVAFQCLSEFCVSVRYREFLLNCQGGVIGCSASVAWAAGEVANSYSVSPLCAGICAGKLCEPNCFLTNPCFESAYSFVPNGCGAGVALMTSRTWACVPGNNPPQFLGEGGTWENLLRARCAEDRECDVTATTYMPRGAFYFTLIYTTLPSSACQRFESTLDVIVRGNVPLDFGELPLTEPLSWRPTRYVFLGSGTGAWVFPGCTRTVGMVPLPNATNQWSAARQFQLALPGEVSGGGFVVDDVKWDLNGDGRFNALDLAIAQNYIGVAVPPFLSALDINSSGILDAVEVEPLAVAVNTGLDSGVFGDRNQDGVLSCCDRQGIPSGVWNFGPCSSSYLIMLDYDLDGDLDSLDQSQFVALNLPVDLDFNNDGIEQDPTDLEALLSVYSGGPCVPGTSQCDSIDINCDGIEFDPTDIDLFQDAYSGSGGC